MERLVEIEKFDAEESSEVTLRPDAWNEYIGQEQIKKNLGVFIEASKKETKHLTMFYFMDLQDLERLL
jgi:Holliday junction DNA helicase RuvB